MNYLKILEHFISGEFCFVDVGAFRGDFSNTILESIPNSKGLLVEPTQESYQFLVNRFSSNKKISVLNKALGFRESVVDFFSTTDSAQNSLLEFTDRNVEVVKSKVKIETLDLLLINDDFLNTIDFIKIDTQGYDLDVLKGGKETILKYQPAILSEFIFVPLYKNQCFYQDQIAFMNELIYKLAGVYNIHFHESGCLAFADLLFLPRDKFERISQNISTNSNFISCDYSLLLEKNQKLAAICAERLKLINYINTEAEKRLEIINILNAEIERLRGVK